MTNLVIKGAYYYDNEADQILIPHFTGVYHTVDCTQYVRKSEIKDKYSKSYWKENKSNYIKREGVKYFYAEYSPHSISKWELLSDLSNLTHNEEDFDF